MADHVLALDQGTTSSRAIVFDGSGAIVSVAQRETRQICPQPGWVEQDPEEIWQTQIETARLALSKAGLTARDVACIGIANQRETTLCWDRRTGEPLGNAIVWQCRRTAPACDDLRARGLAEVIQAKTGLVVDAYFSATKLAWILDHGPDARRRAARGELAFGTVDTWLLWRLTGGGVHATDVTNASRTMLFDIHRTRWDEELLAELAIPPEALPAVRPSSGAFGETGKDLLGAAVPIAGVAGDQQAALFGQCCQREGMAKNTYGTGCFLLMNTGKRPAASRNGLLTTIAWDLGSGVEYAIEGSVFVGGAVIQWLRDELGLLRAADESEDLARSVPDTGGVYVVPAFVGLGAPYWDQSARGAILGLTRGVGCCHIVRAALESIAYQSADVLAAMNRDAASPLRELRVDGGACANDFLLQFQADIVGVPVVRPPVIETTALGVAYLAGLATGVWASPDDLPSRRLVDRRFEPSMTDEERERRMSGWRQAVERVRSRP
ncbi:MAG: glycerol kinase GlpK [Armatimonadota bacterium]|jgi:glycerol kinase